MTLEELLTLTAAPIYATILANFMAQKNDEPPSVGWKDLAMALALAEAQLLWTKAQEQARE